MINNEIYERQPDGSVMLIKSELIDVNFKTVEEEIREKEEELLKIYNELQNLKLNNSNQEEE